MDRLRRAFALVTIAIAAGTGVAACGNGDGDLLTQRRASELRDSVDRVQELADAGDCAGATAAAQDLEQEAQDLPDRVDGQLRDALLDSSDRLTRLVEESCAEATGTTGPAAPAAEPAQPADEQQEDLPPGQQKKEQKDTGKDKKQDEQQSGQDEQVPPEDVPLPDPGGDGGSGVDPGSGGAAP
jgi:hypothetical protein